MEESEKRRERLKAMRMEATQSGVHNDLENFSGSHGLSNPLMEASATPPMQLELCATPRFDYYTDPMSAFSGNKRMSKVSHQISQDHYTPPRPKNLEMTSSPIHQAQPNYFVGQSFQAGGLHNGPGPYSSPIGFSPPFGLQQGTPPGVWNGYGGTSSYYLSNSSSWRNFPSPGLGRGDSPNFSSRHDSGYRFNRSPGPNLGRGGGPGPNSGRGRGRWSNNGPSPKIRQDGGRGFGSRDHVSAEVRPDLYYNKSMVEDPWKFMKPVIWSGTNDLVKSLNTPGSLKSWFSKPDGMKKARVSEASNESSSQPSLAEYLVASFNEAINNEAVNDEPDV